MPSGQQQVKSALLGALLTTGYFGSAQAAVITTYATRAAFDAAVGSTTFENFDAAPLVSFGGVSVDLGPFEVLRTGAGFVATFEGGGGSSNIDGTRYGRVDTFEAREMIFTFDAPITAFGLDVDAWNDDALRTTVTADGTSVPVTTQAGQGSRFFGFSSDTPFTEVRFTPVVGIGDSWGFDNLAFGGAAVPEPASLALLGLGLLGMGWSRRRK